MFLLPMNSILIQRKKVILQYIIMVNIQIIGTYKIPIGIYSITKLEAILNSDKNDIFITLTINY